MYLEPIPEDVKTSTRLKIQYDCCGKEHVLKHCDAKENFEENGGKYICRPCGLKINNPARKKEVRDKIKRTTLERYGVSCSLNKAEHIQSRSEKYEDPEYVAQITAKRKETCLETYGVDHPMKTQEVQEKQKAVIRKKYGVDHPLQNAEILEKAKQTNLEKYGTEWGLSSPAVRLKGIETMLENYGVEYYNQLPAMKDYLRKNCKEWLAESYANPWAKGIVRPEEWNEKQRETVLELMDKGEWTGGPKDSLKGNYCSNKCKRINPLFRSSYELKTHWHLDNDLTVEWYDYEPFQVAYTDTENKKRYYIIDFVVKYKNSTRLIAIEVKNNYSKDTDLNRRKYYYFQNECADIIDLEIWANDKISSLNLDIEKLITSDKVTLIE